MNLNPEVLYVLRECDGLLSEVWIITVQHSEELICNIFTLQTPTKGRLLLLKSLYCNHLLNNNEGMRWSFIRGMHYCPTFRGIHFNFEVCRKY